MNDLLARLVSSVIPATGADTGVRELARLLALSTDEVRAIPTNPRMSYRPFTIRKRRGGERQITAPSGPLKVLQRRLLRGYLAQQPLHAAAIAFRPGHSIATHARRHLGQNIVLTVDLADFFPSTTARRVRRWFCELGWRGEALNVLMRLCVYRGALPQGAPTSPALSNLVNRRLDEDLSEIAAIHGARYSRYSDDLAFSFGTDVEPMAFRSQVAGKLDLYGYQIQAEKGWRLQHAEQHPEMTGLVLAGRRLRLSERILRRMRLLKSRWFFWNAKDRERFQGYVGLRKMLR